MSCSVNQPRRLFCFKPPIGPGATAEDLELRGLVGKGYSWFSEWSEFVLTQIRYTGIIYRRTMSMKVERSTGRPDRRYARQTFRNH